MSRLTVAAAGMLMVVVQMVGDTSCGEDKPKAVAAAPLIEIVALVMRSWEWTLTAMGNVVVPEGPTKGGVSVSDPTSSMAIFASGAPFAQKAFPEAGAQTSWPALQVGGALPEGPQATAKRLARTDSRNKRIMQQSPSRHSTGRPDRTLPTPGLLLVLALLLALLAQALPLLVGDDARG